MSSTLSVCHTSDENSLGAMLGELVLRISGGGYEDHTIRLSESKVTVGSGSDCTVQLRDDDVDPLHCIILRGNASTVIRSWGSRSKLDGHEFSDACLTVGACLQLGDVQLRAMELHSGDLGQVCAEERDDANTEQGPDAVAADRCRCEQCGARFTDFESRLSSIERQLDQLAEARRNAPLHLADSDPYVGDNKASASPAISDGSAPRGLPLASLNEEAAYSACPVDGLDDELRGSGAEAHKPSDLPSWAEAYQGDDVDESVKDYVEHLLRRVGNAGDKKDEGEAEATRANSRADGAPATAGRSPILAAIISEEDDPPTISQVPDESCDLPDEPYAPRSFPPERLTSLSEMREVANVSAQAAIRTFEKNLAHKNALDRVPLMLVGLACGIFLFFFATTRNAGFAQALLFAGAAVSLIAGAGAGWQAVSVLRRWMSSGSATRSTD